MATTLASRNLGPAGTPHSVRELRQSSFDLHETLGFPVIHKHKWNELDLQQGLVERCPYHDEAYDRDDFDDVCFGTGYVGGFSDPVITYVTLQDAAQQTVKIGPQGTLMLDQHPQLTAPWLPLMGDGDLIILADFVPGTWEILDTHERYELQQVRPITIRGPEFRTSSTTLKRLRISQEASVDRLPLGHPFMDVPVQFDYSNVPNDVNPDEPDPEQGVGTFAAYDAAVRILGVPKNPTSSKEQEVRVAVKVDNAFASYGARIVGAPKGTHVFNVLDV